MSDPIYHYDNITSEYLHSTIARLDPLDNNPMLPAHATFMAPPTTAANEVAVHNGTAWEVKPDYRGETWYQTDGTAVEFTDIGQQPDVSLSKTFPAPVSLANAKAAKVEALRASCRKEIFTGYDSLALGTTHHYPLSGTDQTNLQMAYTGAINNQTNPAWSEEIQALASGEVAPVYRTHNAAQVLQVVDDVTVGKKAALSKLATLLAQVDTATDEAAVSAIVW